MLLMYINKTIFTILSNFIYLFTALVFYIYTHTQWSMQEDYLCLRFFGHILFVSLLKIIVSCTGRDIKE